MARKSKRNTGINLNRSPAKREVFDLVLIVCEDSKSSPNYFKDLAKQENISSANIIITGDCGSAPISVVDKAICEYEKSCEFDKEGKLKKTVKTYDRVFCVVDRDEHTSFKQAFDKLKAHKNKEYPIYWIASYPSFEYWYLCHFEKTTKPIQKAKDCEKLLNIHWKKEFKQNYHKGKSKSHSLLQNKTNIAINNSQQTLKSALSNENMNPSTTVHELVEYLQNIKS